MMSRLVRPSLAKLETSRYTEACTSSCPLRLFLPSSQGQSKSRQRVRVPRGLRTTSVPKWSKTSRRYWEADRTCSLVSLTNSVKYSPKDITRRLRAYDSRRSAVVWLNHAFASRRGDDIGFYGNTHLRVPLAPCITSLAAPSTVYEEGDDRLR